MKAQTKSPLFTSARIGGLELPNRPIMAGCYEGLVRGGSITDRLIEHHRRLAEDGIAMTTLGYLAVSADGRGFAHELWARPELKGAFLGCCMAPDKDEKMKSYVDWLRYQMQDLKVPVKMKTSPKAADLKGYDVVLNATGAVSPRNLHAAVREGAEAAMALGEKVFFNSNDALITDLPLDVASQLVR